MCNKAEAPSQLFPGPTPQHPSPRGGKLLTLESPLQMSGFWEALPILHNSGLASHCPHGPAFPPKSWIGEHVGILHTGGFTPQPALSLISDPVILFSLMFTSGLGLVTLALCGRVPVGVLEGPTQWCAETGMVA